ncbi:unnamed protein product [Dicrocoelium dendriticum]|nr:unnamed protein product [Dicrocoelium dendriticum]
MNSFDIVLTSGGIGPTHDDVTFEGLAKALNESTLVHPELLHVVENFFGFDSSLGALHRLACIPASSELVYGIDHSTGRQSNYPVVKVRNIYALPGIPTLFHTAFEIIKEHLRDRRICFHSRSLYVTQGETVIAAFLSSLADKYREEVGVGSYPTFNNSYYKVRVALDSMSESALQSAYQEAFEHLKDHLISYVPDPVTKASSAVYALASDVEHDRLSRCVATSIKIIEDIFHRFTPSEMVIGFNGGKDCTVLLHLVYAVFLRRIAGHSPEAGCRARLASEFPRLLYIRSRSVFPELENFVQRTLQFYRLSSKSILRPTVNAGSMEKREKSHGGLIVFEGDIKSSLDRLLKDFPDVRGVLMGTRLSDPRASHLSPVIMTDAGWPQILRINPLLDWTYSDVWQFIRTLSLPYCSLYDVGYTSIGSMEDTHPNPNLRYITESGRCGYRPAYTLADPESERSGRSRSIAPSRQE